MTSTEIIARYLEKTVIYRGSLCRIERYDPLGSALCDVLVRELEGSDAGREFWVASHSLRLEGGGKMPHRGELRRQADRETVSHLRRFAPFMSVTSISAGPVWSSARPTSGR